MSGEHECRFPATQMADGKTWIGPCKGCGASVGAVATALQAERDDLKKELLAWEDREGAVCPEDVGFEEVIRGLRARVAGLEAAETIRQQRYLNRGHMA